MTVFAIVLFDLALQFSLLGILVTSMILERKKKMRLHGSTMLAAVVLNIISFGLVMGPMWDNIVKVRPVQLG